MRLVLVRTLLVLSGLVGGAVVFLLGWEAYLRAFSVVQVVNPPMVQLDPVVGLAHRPGIYRDRTPEFDVVYRINSRGDPDDEPETFRGVRPILALGDSHTAATGVGNRETWPNVLESMLGEGCARPVQVYNMAMGGYSLSQEYLRLMRDGLQLNPTAVVLGFSIATDEYDLLPPDRAMFPSVVPMQYLDLDGDGLVVRSWPGQGIAAARTNGSAVKHWQVYKAVKRSPIGLLGVAVLRRLGVKIWPTMDFVLSRELDETQRYAWTLVERVLLEFQRTLDARGIHFLVLVIPYYPQVYDYSWRWAYAFDPGRFDRYAANRRIDAICRRNGIDCLDLTGSFVEAVKAGQQLHYPQDGHPNVAGHALIARQTFTHISCRFLTARR